MLDHDALTKRFKEVVPAGCFTSLRVLGRRDEQVNMRQGIVQPVGLSDDTGAMVTVIDGSGLGYGATSDLSTDGLRAAVAQARTWAKRSAGKGVFDFEQTRPADSDPVVQSYVAPVDTPWDEMPLAAKVELLKWVSGRLKATDAIVDWSASLWFSQLETLYVTSCGTRLQQSIQALAPGMSVTAFDGHQSQTRTFGGRAFCQTGGMEVLDRVGFEEAPEAIAREGLELLSAPDCPTDTRDVLLAPD